MEFSERTGFTGMRCPKARFSNQFWSASSELAFCEQFIGQLRLLEQTKRSVIPARCAARGIRSSSKNFSVSSAVRWCLRRLERSHRRFLRRGLSGGTLYGARDEIFYTIQPPLAPHELMPSQPVITTARECSPALLQRVSQNSYAVIIREVSRTRSLPLIPGREVRHVRRSRSQPTLKST
jgi:hypothetical protein